MSDREVRSAGEYVADEDISPQGGSGTAHTSPEPPPPIDSPPLDSGVVEGDAGVSGEDVPDEEA